MKLTDYITYIEPLKRFRQYWTAKIGQTEVPGDTREEATKNLFTFIQNSLNGSYTPILLFHYGHVALIWRANDQWFYTTRQNGRSGPVHSNIHCVGDQDRTEQAARRHLADYALDEGRSPEEAASIIEVYGDYQEFIHQCERTKRVQQLMEEYHVNWQTASEINDGLRTAPHCSTERSEITQ